MNGALGEDGVRERRKREVRELVVQDIMRRTGYEASRQ